jgi:hypothetical protein
MALETLGELRSAGAVNELIDFLEEENSYLYEAAEHALAKLDNAVIDAARARLEAGNLQEDSGHSLLIILCESGAGEALKTVLDHLEFFIEAAGPGNTARWLSLFAASFRRTRRRWGRRSCSWGRCTTCGFPRRPPSAGPSTISGRSTRTRGRTATSPVRGMDPTST